MNGDASLSYSKYDATNAQSSASSSSLIQKYSLMYTTNGVIYNSRIGSYNVSLGYSWSAFDTTFKSSTPSSLTKNSPTSPDFEESYNQNRGHFTYLGEIKIDPKEIPFRLNAYSRDLSGVVTTTSNGRVYNRYESMIGGSDQPTNMSNGLHIESGATLIAGVKNGMTNGYNEYLRHFPMILIDFKDSINRDLSSTSQFDDRLTRLAFVSLNKKDNWFHYRHTQYQDYLNSKNNYEENQIQLGTVDQFMARRWIDFTNWIRVSTDIELTKRKSVGMVNSNQDINLNLFVAAERTKWSAQTFSSFSRQLDEHNKISYQTNLPLYVSGVINQDLSWNARTSLRENQDIDRSGARSDFSDMLAGYRVEAFKRAPFVLSQFFDVESVDENSSKSVTFSGGITSNSTALFSKNSSVGASYSIRNTTNSNSSGSSSSNFTAHNFDLNAGYAPSNTLRFNVKQSNSFTQGKLNQIDTTTSNSQTQLSQYDSQGHLLSGDLGSESYQSISTLSIAWHPKPRLNISFALSEDIYKSTVQSKIYSTAVQSALSFSREAWDVNYSLSYSLDNFNTSNFSNNASLKYVHSRNLNATVSASYGASSSSKGESSDSTSFAQGLNYSYYTTNGQTRKLLEIYENFTSTFGTPKSAFPTSNSLSLGFRYYPIRRLTLAGGAGYSYSTSMNDYSLIWNASAVMDFRLIQASVDYVSGIRTSDKLRENKLTGNIRKSF